MSNFLNLASVLGLAIFKKFVKIQFVLKIAAHTLLASGTVLLLYSLVERFDG